MTGIRPGSTREHAWPYPSYADRNWLGGERGDDPALGAVVRSVRSLVIEAGGRAGPEPEALLAGLGQLAALRERVDWGVLALVGGARTLGTPGASVGAAPGGRQQAAQQRVGPHRQGAVGRRPPARAPTVT